jgi:DNA-binding CsgD family transcriptional regulator
MRDALEVLIEELSSVKDAGVLMAAAHEFARGLGFEGVAYLSPEAVASRVIPRGHVTYPPTWIERYIDQDYAACDPIFLNPGFLPSTWVRPETHGDLSPKALRMFDEAAEFDVNCGISMMIRESTGGTRVSVISGQTGAEAVRFTEDRKHVFLVGASYVHEAMLMLGKPSLEVPTLTAREQECLYWAAKGKTAGEIAAHVGISKRTVTFHVESVRRKIGVATTKQAAAVAMSLGLIAA